MTNDEWIYNDAAEVPDDDKYYYGKYIFQTDKDSYSIRLNKNHIQQLQLIFTYCCDRDRVNGLREAKYFHKDLLSELEDVLRCDRESGKLR